MADAALKLERFKRLRPRERSLSPGWSRKVLAGRLCELSGTTGSARLTLAFRLVLDAQLDGEPVAWVSATSPSFYPPDGAAMGIDLEALVVVRVSGARKAARAADKLLRSGAFGLVVLDLGPAAEIPMALQGRLVQLARAHDAAVLCLTEKAAPSPSIGSMVSLRVEAHRERIGENRFTCTLKSLKDKRNGPGWTYTEEYRGPPGLR